MGGGGGEQLQGSCKNWQNFGFSGPMSMTKPLLYLARKKGIHTAKNLNQAVLVREPKADAGPTVFFHSTKSFYKI